MFAYKEDKKGNIIEELIDPKVVPKGFLTTSMKLDASIHMMVNGSIMLKPNEVPKPAVYIKMTNEQKLNSIREQRNILLRETDWTQTLDAPLSREKQAEYKVYRQALRELPARADLDLDSPWFPKKPQ